MRVCPTGIVGLLVVCGSLAFASDSGGVISGLISDGDGRPAAASQVTLTDSDGFRLLIMADLSGRYIASNLPAGRYDVTVESADRNARATATATVRSDRRVELPIQLRHRWATAVAESPVLLTAASEVTRGEEGGNIEGYGPWSLRGNQAINAAGQRGQENNFVLDGADNNEIWLRGPALVVSENATSEVSLLDVWTPADKGYAAGAVLVSKTRRGVPDALHGEVFEALGNSALDARNAFDGAVRPGLLRNDFGGSIGGPVRENGWTFFASADSLRERDGLTVISTVPSAAQKSGSFGNIPVYDPLSLVDNADGTFSKVQFPGNQIPVWRIPAVAQNLAALYPDPNLPGAAANFRLTPSLIDNQDRLSARTDKILSARSTLFVRGEYERNAQQSPGALPNDAGSDLSQNATAANSSLDAGGAVVAWTFTATPALDNDLRASVTSLSFNGQPADAARDASGFPGVAGLGDGLPVVDAPGYAQLGAAEAVPFQLRETSYELQDNLHWTHGRHRFAFGAQALRRQLNGNAGEWTSRGTYLFAPDYTGLPGVWDAGNSVAALLLGYPNEVRREVQAEPFRLRDGELAGYAKDEIRLGRRLTADVGVRYSLYPPLTEADNRMVNFNFARQIPALDQFAGHSGVNQYAGAGYSTGAIAPRVGIAWDMFGNGSTVVRAGFSKNVDAGPWIAQSVLARNPPYASILDRVNGTFQVGSNITAGLPAPQFTPALDAAGMNAAGAVYAMETQRFTPYADQWGLFIDQRLQRDLTLEIGGIGSMGIHLYESYDLNPPVPAPNSSVMRYPFQPSFARVEYVGKAGGSTYYGGQARLTGRMGRGLNVAMCYRLAKAEDDATEPGTSQDSRPSTPQYTYLLRGNRSVSPFDVMQRLVAMATYDSPFHAAALRDWRVSTVVTAQGGLPFTPQLAINSLNNGNYQLPNRVGFGSLPASQRSSAEWFNTSLDPTDPGHAFEVPPLFAYGDSGFDILRGPGLATVDFALERSFASRERPHLLMRGEALNLMNSTNLALPGLLLGTPSAGVISHTATQARQLQLTAKLSW